MTQNQLNIIPYRLLQEIVVFLNKRPFMPIRIGKQEYLGGKKDSRFLGLSGCQ